MNIFDFAKAINKKIIIKLDPQAHDYDIEFEDVVVAVNDDGIDLYTRSAKTYGKSIEYAINSLTILLSEQKIEVRTIGNYFTVEQIGGAYIDGNVKIHLKVPKLDLYKE
jgi:hypothetical protein